MTTNNNAKIEEFLRQEIKSFKRSTTISIVFGVVLTIILVGYFLILNSNLNKIIKPEPLSEFLYNETSLLIPKLEKELKVSLKSTIPVIVKNIINEIKKSIPELRRYVEIQLKKITDEAIKTGVARLEGVYKEVILASKAKIIEAEKKGEPIDVNVFYENLDKALKKMLAEKVTDGSGETIFTKLELAHKKLNELNEKLKLLATKTNLSQREKLEKKFIQSWIMIVGKINQAVKTDEPSKPQVIRQTVPVKLKTIKKKSKSQPKPKK